MSYLRRHLAVIESGLPGYLELDPADQQEALRAYLDLAVARDLAEIAPAAVPLAVLV